LRITERMSPGIRLHIFEAPKFKFYPLTFLSGVGAQTRSDRFVSAIGRCQPVVQTSSLSFAFTFTRLQAQPERNIKENSRQQTTSSPRHSPLFPRHFTSSPQLSITTSSLLQTYSSFTRLYNTHTSPQVVSHSLLVRRVARRAPRACSYCALKASQARQNLA
jgi:hypothetical protein